MSGIGGNLLLPLNLPIAVRANCCCYLPDTAPIKTKRNRRKALKLWAQSDDSPQSAASQQQVNLSVLRFTFGGLIFLWDIFTNTLWALLCFTISLVVLSCLLCLKSIGIRRNTLVGRILLAQMDWLWFRIPYSVEPFCWFKFTCNLSSACELTSWLDLPFLGFGV